MAFIPGSKPGTAQELNDYRNANFIDNDILVVTKDELVPRFYEWNSLKSQLRRHKDKPTGLKRYSRGGGRGNRLLILFDSLPATIREAIGDPRRVNISFCFILVWILMRWISIPLMKMPPVLSRQRNRTSM